MGLDFVPNAKYEINHSSDFRVGDFGNCSPIEDRPRITQLLSNKKPELRNWLQRMRELFNS